MPDGPITVLMLAVQWPPETFLFRMADGLAASGVRVHLAVRRRDGQALLGGRPSLVNTLRTPGIEIIDLPSPDLPLLVRAWKLAGLLASKIATHPRGVLKLWRLIGRRPSHRVSAEALRALYRYLPFVGTQADVLHFQWNSSATDYELLFEMFDRPAVVSCRGSQVLVGPHNPERSDLVEGLRRTFEKAARVHCVCDAVATEGRRYGLGAEKTVVIRPAVDPRFFSPPALRSERRPGEPLRIVTVGSVSWVKDHESAAVAIRALRDAGLPVTFDIFGDGPDRQWIEFTAVDLGISDCLHLHGHVSPQRCRDALRGAHVFLLSSVSEGISNAALEAMACGLPLVTTDCGGMREAVRDGIDGFVVPLRDPRAMAAALARLARDEGLRQTMGNAARQRIVEHFSIETQIARFQALYREVIDDVRQDRGRAITPTGRHAAVVA